MTNFPERLNRVVTLQRRAFFINALLSFVASYAVNVAYPVTNFIVSVLISAAVIWFTMRALNIVSLLIIQWMVYGSNTEAIVNDAQEAFNTMSGEPASPEPQTKLTHFIIAKTPEKPIARFMDADIFEWLDLRSDDGRTVRYEYIGTIDLSRGEKIPDNTIVLPPGIVMAPLKSG